MRKLKINQVGIEYNDDGNIKQFAVKGTFNKVHNDENNPSKIFE